MIAVIGAFNQEEALVGTFFMIVNIRDPSFEALVCKYLSTQHPGDTFVAR